MHSLTSYENSLVCQSWLKEGVFRVEVWAFDLPLTHREEWRIYEYIL